MRKINIFGLFLVLSFSIPQGTHAQEKYRHNRCLWASINTNKNSIYPSSDAEYAPALGKILVSWRLLPQDDYETAFDLYRQPAGKARQLITGTSGVIASTCFQDSYNDFSQDITYELTYHGQKSILGTYTIKASQLQAGVPFVGIPLQTWEDCPQGFIYKVNDCSFGDLDGDGQPEIVLKRGFRPDSLLLVNGGLSEEDNPLITHTTMWEAYKLDGTMLWRVFSGPNIQSGNSTSFAVYDFDGDGKCEVVTRLSEGAVFGDGKVIGDTNGDGKTDYRTFQSSNHIHGAPEFICVIDGESGQELARAEFIPTGSLSEAWGDSYWKRAASVRIGVIRCDADTTSILVSRGIYARSVVEAWDYTDGQLKRRWHFDSNAVGCGEYAGQGYHSLFVGDVDQDGLDEMCYGSMTLDHDGSPLYVSGSTNGVETVIHGAQIDNNFTGYGHGDALHMGDFLPDRPGLEIWSCFETGNYGAALRDAATGETIWNVKNNSDVGRCSVADIFPEYPGCEMWWYGGKIMTADGQEVMTDGGNAITPSADNMAVWFTGSINRQLLDGNKICTNVASTGKERRPLRANYFNAKAINGTKNNPCIYADILGDWREEVIYVDSAETQLKIFSTWYPTDYRFRPLLEDHHYEMSALNENIGYNQPTETGGYMGSDMLTGVSFTEANGYEPVISIYRDSLLQSNIANGQLIAGRTYYFRAVKLGVGIMKGCFVADNNNSVVEFDLLHHTTSTDIKVLSIRSLDPTSRVGSYRIDGQRVETIGSAVPYKYGLPHGIYIINGKKIVR